MNCRPANEYFYTYSSCNDIICRIEFELEILESNGYNLGVIEERTKSNQIGITSIVSIIMLNMSV